MALKDMNSKEKVIFGIEMGIAVIGGYKTVLQPLKVDTSISSNLKCQTQVEKTRGQVVDKIDNLLGQLSDNTEASRSSRKQFVVHKKKEYSDKRFI
ncbi:TPA: hypothetical protein U1344_001935 [Streptococcus suis]|nr:hypothetical protein [Streptococcus suis]HEL1838509.1 hypothetical protein [Streptococcus suis]HEL2553602.1 hypothetical protein [Streptococcus suis]HEM2749403.1 hypothetical protein [Streptococcus suis]HEM4989627.1 hypothetical protein [Streptococcus suis]